MRIFSLSLFCCLTVLFSGCGPAKPPGPVVRSAIVLHTVATLTAEGPNAAAAITESLARLKELELRFDPDQPTSDIARLNAAAGETPVTLSPEACHLLAVARNYAERTDGAFDPTIGPVSRLWRAALANEALPDNEAVAKAQALVHWQKLRLLGNGQAFLEEAGMAVDAGAAVKGLALDEVRRIYRRHGVQSGLISLGESSLYAVGAKKNGEPWQIALRHPRNSLPASLGRLPLADAALSTSGDYEQFIDIKGTRFHHILDPVSGWPAMNGTAAVALVIAGDEPDACLLTDILSTALFVMGPERGLRFLNTLPFPSDAVFADAAGTMRKTDGFRWSNP